MIEVLKFEVTSSVSDLDCQRDEFPNGIYYRIEN